MKWISGNLRSLKLTFSHWFKKWSRWEIVLNIFCQNRIEFIFSNCHIPRSRATLILREKIQSDWNFDNNFLNFQFFPEKKLKDYSNFDFRRKFFATLSQLRSCFKIMFFLNLLKETPFCKRYDSDSFLRTLHFINIFRNFWMTLFLGFCNLQIEAIFASYFDQIWETLTLVKKM